MTDTSTQFLNHKPGCLYDTGDGKHPHRVPIDCVTLESLFSKIDILTKEIDFQKNIVIQLKAKLYDFYEESGKY